MANIILVEDDKVLLNALKTHLINVGHTIILSSTDGSAVLNSPDLKTADILICDIILPAVEGITIIRNIRKCNNDLKIIAMSGQSISNSKSLLRMAEKLGANAVLAKPFRIQALFDTIRSLK